MTNEQCAAVAHKIQYSLIQRLLDEERITKTRARELEAKDVYAVVAECHRYTPRIEIPFPAAGMSIVFDRDKGLL